MLMNGLRSKSLLLLLFLPLAVLAPQEVINLSIAWEAPTTRINGTSLSPNEISHYEFTYQILSKCEPAWCEYSYAQVPDSFVLYENQLYNKITDPATIEVEEIELTYYNVAKWDYLISVVTVDVNGLRSPKAEMLLSEMYWDDRPSNTIMCTAQF